VCLKVALGGNDRWSKNLMSSFQIQNESGISAVAAWGRHLRLNVEALFLTHPSQAVLPLTLFLIP
jgi:hypothetical protein